MAVTSIWPIKYRLDKVIRYVENPEKITEEYYSENAAMHIIDGVVEYAADDTKTERREYVTCLNCNEGHAAREFQDVKKLWKKDDGRLCYHGYQSFKPGEVNAQTAHAIGVELATRLWGDRFQVVVATHCNTGVYHTHFVINSVSFRDGYKFYNSPADYRQMREVSDRICREYGISVIENPDRHGKNYGQFSAEQNGKPTHSQMIRNDIDRAVAASLTEQEFFRTMQELGYTITTHGASGAPLKHPKLTPPNGRKNFRFDTLGEEYALEAVLERVHQNMRRKPLFEVPPVKHYHAKMTRKPVKKLTGLRALYFRYCYELGIIVKHPNRTKRVSYLLRDDVIKLDRYIAEAKMLLAHQIETIQDLDAYRETLTQKIDRLGNERKELRNRLKQATRRHDVSGIAEIQSEIKRVSKELKKARKEVEYCGDVAERSEQVHQNLLELNHDKENLRKERYPDEYPSGSGRSGREDFAGRLGARN
jgi:hypothetical protein